MPVRISLTAAAVGLLTAAHVVHPPQTPDVSGTWVLNQEESDDARTQLGELRDDAGPPAGGNTGRRRSGTPRAGNTRRAPGSGSPGAREGDAEGMRILMQMALQPARLITITQPDSTVIITMDNERSLVLVTDGRARRDSMAEAAIEISATWEEDGHLLVTRRIAGRQLRERYSRAPGTDQLIVETRLSLARGNPVELRRVYDAATDQPADRELRRPERGRPSPPPRERPARP